MIGKSDRCFRLWFSLDMHDTESKSFASGVRSGRCSLKYVIFMDAISYSHLRERDGKGVALTEETECRGCSRDTSIVISTILVSMPRPGPGSGSAIVTVPSFHQVTCVGIVAAISNIFSHCAVPTSHGSCTCIALQCFCGQTICKCLVFAYDFE